MKIDVLGRLARWAVIVALAGISGLTPIGAISGRACGQTPVDLELGGTGSTAWSIADIKPGDGGVQSVELRNAGSRDGRVSIWISDITESDHGGDGARLDNYLLFDISCSSLSTFLALPAGIYQLPQDPQDKRLIIYSLGSGENVTLVWEWVFQETGLPQNDAQGDSLSFTINYLMEDISTTGNEGGAIGPKFRWLKIDMLGHTTSARINQEGTLSQSVTATDSDGIISLQFNAGTTITCTGGELPVLIEMRTSREPPAAADGTRIIGPAYDIVGYTDASTPCPVFFSPPVILTLSYDDSVLPSDNASINVGSYDAGDDWTALESSSGSASLPGRVSAPITQASTFAVLAIAEASAPGPAPVTTPSAPDPAGPLTTEPGAPSTAPAGTVTTPGSFQAPAHFELSELVIEPAQVRPGEPVTISGFLRNTGGLPGSYTLELGIDGETEQSREIQLAGGESAQVVFSIVRNVPGTYTVTLGGLSGEFTVLAPALSDYGSGVPWEVPAVTVTTAGLLVYLIVTKFKVVRLVAKLSLKRRTG